MSRSKWKSPHVEAPFSLVNNLINNQARASTILPSFIGKDFNVYNGRKVVSIRVTSLMIGHKFGEFVQTRKIYKYKYKKQ